MKNEIHGNGLATLATLATNLLKQIGISSPDEGKQGDCPEKKPLIQFVCNESQVEPFLKPCPLCHGRDFIHGIRGGYFCVNCQPGQHGELVKAGKR